MDLKPMKQLNKIALQNGIFKIEDKTFFNCISNFLFQIMPKMGLESKIKPKEFEE